MMQPCERTSDSVRQPVKTETENRASTDLKGEITMKKIYSAAELEHIANERRKDVIEMLYRSSAGHVGGDMSVMEILTTLYYRVMNVGADKMHDPDRDRFVLSKGHCADALYTILGDLGYFDKEDLMQHFSSYGSIFIGHPNTDVPGIEVNGGSLGHGLAVGTGMAIAGKMDKKDYRVYVVLGDGEMAEGSNYEAMMAAAQYHLDNLCATVDLNGLQISGTTDEVMSTRDMKTKFEAFNWNVIEVADGNDPEELLSAYELASKFKGRPTAVIAHTVKGKGISYMENQASWHHGVMTEDQFKEAEKEIAEEIENG